MSTALQKQEVFPNSALPMEPSGLHLKAPAANPSPGEAAIYGAASEVASGIFEAGDVSHQAPVSGRRSLATRTSPPLYSMPRSDQPAEI